ncbi:MAG: hypothetical protein II002_03835 [Bacteroidales bacterium]|nr:hypothetical protein [Bacteroidales bacterium]
MGDEHQRAGERPFQVVFQPLDGLDVEMVGRLVEQQHVGPAQQDLRQFDAHVPALREGFRLAAELGFLEAQTGERPLNRLFRRFALRDHKGVVYFVEFNDKLMISI